MSTAHEGFTDNWSYLRAELGWLDQVLLAAVARQKKQTKDIDRIAQTRADRVTSHWWKGVVSLEGHPSYDEHRKPPASPTSKTSFQQQLELRIQSSQKKGVVLGLPLLRDRLGLSIFEKNTILIGLAPEINRRYARLYRFLKGDDEMPDSDLPSVDLILRLLCRNDQEWSAARKAFAADAALVRQRIVELYTCGPDTRLKSTLRLADGCVEFLLATQPSVDSLDWLLSAPAIAGYLCPPQPALPVGTTSLHPTSTWDDLVMPQDVITVLQCVCQRIQAQSIVDQEWGWVQRPSAVAPGIVLRVEGAAGTGKTLAAHAIAQTLKQPLTIVDLNQVGDREIDDVLEYLHSQSPPVLLLSSVEHWFGRTAAVPSSRLHQWLAQRWQTASITLLETSRPSAIAQAWKAKIPLHVTLPLPTERDRQTLWKRAFPDTVPRAETLPWRWVAKSFEISGGEIQAIARDAALYAAATQESVSTAHLVQALTQRGHKLPSSPPRPRRSRQPSS